MKKKRLERGGRTIHVQEGRERYQCESIRRQRKNGERETNAQKRKMRMEAGRDRS